MSASRRFQFQKPSHVFVGTHHETLSVVAVRVNIQIVRPLESTAR
jgi:hypothetical protein